MLIVFGGLPGTGKTTISKALAAKRSAAYLRIDEIEYALRGHLLPGQEMGLKGYILGEAIALSNLKLGNSVVADSVNPMPDSRRAWRRVAAIAQTRLLEIEIICSDLAEHRRRVETRQADIDGFKLPDWAGVMAHEYVPWTEPRLILDTAVLSVAEALEKIAFEIKNLPESGEKT